MQIHPQHPPPPNSSIVQEISLTNLCQILWRRKAILFQKICNKVDFVYLCFQTLIVTSPKMHVPVVWPTSPVCDMENKEFWLFGPHCNDKLILDLPLMPLRNGCCEGPFASLFCLALISLRQNSGVSVLFIPICGYCTVAVLFFIFLALYL